MSTLKDPGKYDCLSKLEQDEPYFLLRGKDPLASFVVAAWAQLARGNAPKAIRAIKDADEFIAGIQYARVLELKNQEPDKIAEAFEVSEQMRLWFAGVKVEAVPKEPELVPPLVATKEPDEFKVAFDAEINKTKPTDTF